jgi:hypothetical protein
MQRNAPSRSSRTVSISRIFGGLLLAVLCSYSTGNCESRNAVVVGWVERVIIQPGDMVVSAKVDTGAVSCSLHSVDVQEFVKDGAQWVRFRLKDESGREVVMERPLVGMRKIKRHFGKFQLRPVVHLTICLGPLKKEVDVNLVDRTGFEYPLLIGRNFMDSDILVDPSAKYTVEPSCGGQKP